MEKTDILKEINARFAQDLKRFYKRRIVIWKDSSKEFKEDVDAGVYNNLLNAKFIELTDNNAFFVKKTVCFDDKESNFLIYTTVAPQSRKDNWLLNVELYSEQFNADKISIWMNEMNLHSSAEDSQKRKIIAEYRAFFKSADRRKKVRDLAGGIDKKSTHLRLAMLGISAGLKTINKGEIIRAVLEAGIEDAEQNSILNTFSKYGILDWFKSLLNSFIDFNWVDSNDVLIKLLAHLAISASTSEFGENVFDGLDNLKCSNSVLIANASGMLSDWIRDDSQGYHNLIKKVEQNLQIIVRFEKAILADIANSSYFPCVDDVVIRTILAQIKDSIFSASDISKILDTRRGTQWGRECEKCYMAISRYMDMAQFKREYESGFHHTTAKDVCNAYVKDYYKMDYIYRHFVVDYDTCEKSERFEDFGDILKDALRDPAENLYRNWFLNNLAENWTKVCETEMQTYGRIEDIVQQDSFYNKFVLGEKRTFVIISDAFRYELAVQLKEELSQDFPAKIDLQPMQAIFPTETKFGMAALLPHKKLEIEQNAKGVRILIDGKSSESTNRENILKQTNPLSVAIKAEDFMSLKRNEILDIVKGQDVIYIYHNDVDKGGHADTDLFQVCQKAIDEIRRISKRIINDLSGNRIIVTADHGFLYTQSGINVSDKVAQDVDNSEIIEASDRYIITTKNASTNNLMPVNFTPAKDTYNSFTPRENIRIKRKGGSPKFIHGGISLQELLVPVLEFKRIREDSSRFKNNKEKYDTRPVEIAIATDNKRTTNRIFTLKFYQTEAVGAKRSPSEYELYFTDESGKIISDTQNIIADKKGEDPNDRTFVRTFNLKSGDYNSRKLYNLVIQDKSGVVPPSNIPFQIDIAFTDDGFNL